MNIVIEKLPKFKLDFDIDSSFMRDVALDMKSHIKNRTKKGKDIHGNDFEAYTQATKDYKAGLGKSTTLVNLEDEGDMLKSLSIKSSENFAEIFIIGDRAEIGAFHQFARGKFQREWFGLDEDMRDQINKDISDELSRKVDKA